MNLPAIALGAAALWLLFMPASRRIEKGKTYVALFRPPAGFSLLPNVPLSAQTLDDTFSKLKTILPPGATLGVAGSNVAVTFVAPTTDNIDDLVTPIGTFKLVSFQEVR